MGVKLKGTRDLSLVIKISLIEKRTAAECTQGIKVESTSYYALIPLPSSRPSVRRISGLNVKQGCRFSVILQILSVTLAIAFIISLNKSRNYKNVNSSHS